MESSNTSWDWPNGCTSTNSFNKIQGVRRKRGLEWIRLVRCSKDSMQIIVAGYMWLYIYRYTVYIHTYIYIIYVIIYARSGNLTQLWNFHSYQNTSTDSCLAWGCHMSGQKK